MAKTKRKYTRKKANHNRRSTDRINPAEALQDAVNLEREQYKAFDPNGGDLGRGVSSYQSGFEAGRANERARMQSENSMRASEKAVLFTAMGDLPVRNADSKMLIQRHKENAGELFRLKSELAVRSMLDKELTREMSHRGLFSARFV
jgi:hypothetical protein